jgi:hypothetical protein
LADAGTHADREDPWSDLQMHGRRPPKLAKPEVTNRSPSIDKISNYPIELAGATRTRSSALLSLAPVIPLGTTSAKLNQSANTWRQLSRDCVLIAIVARLADLFPDMTVAELSAGL